MHVADEEVFFRRLLIAWLRRDRYERLTRGLPFV